MGVRMGHVSCFPTINTNTNQYGVYSVGNLEAIHTWRGHRFIHRGSEIGGFAKHREHRCYPYEVSVRTSFSDHRCSNQRFWESTSEVLTQAIAHYWCRPSLMPPPIMHDTHCLPPMRPCLIMSPIMPLPMPQTSQSSFPRQTLSTSLPQSNTAMPGLS